MTYPEALAVAGSGARVRRAAWIDQESFCILYDGELHVAQAGAFTPLNVFDEQADDWHVFTPRKERF